MSTETLNRNAACTRCDHGHCGECNLERFTRWFDWLMIWEGESYENDPDDPGGATKYGIDQRSHPEVDIRALTRDEAKRIYHADYWSRVKADDLPAGVGEVVADIAVNNGRARAARWLQQAVGVTVDGKIGPQTLAAAQTANKHQLIQALIDRRAEFYREIAKGKMSKFLRGWLNRNRDLERFVYDGASRTNH